VLWFVKLSSAAEGIRAASEALEGIQQQQKHLKIGPDWDYLSVFATLLFRLINKKHESFMHPWG
jgi:hypothetical protein